MNQRWGTPMPITIRDKDFGIVRLRANGLYSYHLTDPAVFHQKVAATQDRYTAAELEPHLRNTIVGKVSDAFAQSGVPFLDMAANIEEFSKAMREQVTPMLADFGLTLDSFQVESLSLPEELQKRLDERIGMNMVGDMRQYAQFQAAQSMPIAAANPGGGAALGANLGAGLAMGKTMADAVVGASRAGAGRCAVKARRSSAASAATDPARVEVLPRVRREAGMTGVEWVIDARGCDPARLTDHRSLAELFDGIVDDLSLHVVGDADVACVPGSGRNHRPLPPLRVASRRSHVPRARLALSQRVLLSSSTASGTSRRDCSGMSERRGGRAARRTRLRSAFPLCFRERANGELSELRR